MTTRREWAIRAALMVISPIAVLGLTELLLRVAGAGFPPSFFVPVPGKPVLIANPHFGERFFPKRLARAPAPHLLVAPKPADTYRIFVLGESAAWGVPEPGLSFGRILEVLLNERYPTIRFEVVNAAMTAINSHAILPIARDCARQSPDLFVVYAGNNEVVGPYGPGTVFTSAMNRLPLIRLSVWLWSTRTGQFFGGLLKRRQPLAEWRGMEMFRDKPVSRDDPRLAPMYGHFRRNLEDIVAVARHAGVPVVLSTVAVNLKDCPPFMGSAAQERFRTGQFSEARDLDELRFRADSRINAIIRDVAARTGAALADAERAFGPTPGSDLFYEHVHLKFAGNYLLARTVAEKIDRLRAALTRLPGRAPDRGAHAVHLLGCVPDGRSDERDDGPPPFHEPDRIPGRPPGAPASAPRTGGPGGGASCLFRSAGAPLRGHAPGVALRRVAARGRTLRARRKGMARVDRTRARDQRVARRVGERTGRRRTRGTKPSRSTSGRSISIPNMIWPNSVGAWRWRGASSSRKPPRTTARPYASIRHSWRRATISRSRSVLKAGWPRQLRSFGTLGRDSAEAWEGLGTAAFQSGDLKRAAEAYARAVQANPQSGRMHYDYGLILSRSGQLDAAVEQYREALRLDAGSADIHNNLGTALARQGRFKEAAAHFQKAVQLRPDFSTARANLDRALHEAGSR